MPVLVGQRVDELEDGALVGRGEAFRLVGAASGLTEGLPPMSDAEAGIGIAVAAGLLLLSGWYHLTKAMQIYRAGGGWNRAHERPMTKPEWQGVVGGLAFTGAFCLLAAIAAACILIWS